MQSLPHSVLPKPFLAKQGTIDCVAVTQYEFGHIIQTNCFKYLPSGPYSRRISDRTSTSMGGRPFLLELRVQYCRNPSQCQRTTVSGLTERNASRHFGQIRDTKTQNCRSAREMGALEQLRFTTANCCRNRRSSNARRRRDPSAENSDFGKIDSHVIILER